jgi:hypothetical protein
MDVKSEVQAILLDVAKRLKEIPFPPKEEKQPEELRLHWCEKCRKYHRAQ